MEKNKDTIQYISKNIAIQFMKDESHFITIPDLAYKILSKFNINNSTNRKRIYSDLALALRHLVEEKRVREYYTRVPPKDSSLGQSRYKAYKLI
jgi:hypothetical protein